VEHLDASGIDGYQANYVTDEDEIQKPKKSNEDQLGIARMAK